MPKEGYKAITMSEETFNRLDQERERIQKEWGLQKLSWSDFMDHVADELKRPMKEKK